KACMHVGGRRVETDCDLADPSSYLTTSWVSTLRGSTYRPCIAGNSTFARWRLPPAFAGTLARARSPDTVGRVRGCLAAVPHRPSFFLLVVVGHVFNVPDLFQAR